MKGKMEGLFSRFQTLKYKFSHEEEQWDYSEEPHCSRRREILAKYPEIKQLMGYDPSIAYIVVTEVILQISMCWLVMYTDMSWGPLVALTYIVSGTLNHSLGSAIHEIGHNLAYGHGRVLSNRILGMISNLPMGVPFSVTYKKYHADHHRYLGNYELDADVPTKLECFLFQWPITRIIWLIIHPAIHGIRPFIKKPDPVTQLEAVNFVVQAIFDVILVSVFGPKALFYCVFGTLFGLGFHPLAGHFISEHYMFTEGQATVSYYGPLNPILFNVGYHVEHHDFPYIPWRKLPRVKEMAPEFYDNLTYHTSWLKVIWDFIFMEGMGPQGHGVAYTKQDVEEVKAINQVIKRSNGHMGNGLPGNRTLSNEHIGNGTVGNGTVGNGTVGNGTVQNRNIGNGHVEKSAVASNDKSTGNGHSNGLHQTNITTRSMKKIT